VERDELIQQIKQLLAKTNNPKTIIGVHAEISEFLRNYAGVNSSFYTSIQDHGPRRGNDHAAISANQILNSFLQYVQAGLHQEVSPERRAQLDVVSDFLDMANSLLETKGVHPAAPAVLIGATLEEFLRTWVEAESLSLGSRKLGLETYSQVLRDANLITKQDGKDITSWAGIRNHAAHGEWNEVSDKNRISLMLEGINLFMRKYSA
jgi:hypothetical protein